MTIALAVQTDFYKLVLAIRLPGFKVTSFHFLIVALLLPTIGLLIDGITQPGLLSLAATSTGLGLVVSQLFFELARRVKL